MGKVNVAFHGTFAFLNWGPIVEVLVPSVETHVYRYGDRNGLNDLTQGYTYSLSDVTPAAHSPKEKELGIAIVALNGKRIIVDRSSSLVFCSILLPAPKKCAGAQWWAPFDKQNKRITSAPIFAGADAAPSTKTMTSYAGIHVLTYDSAKVNTVRLAGSDWTPTVNGDVVNIHLFAEPEDRMFGTMGAQHRSKAFSRLMKVLNSPHLEISAAVQGDIFKAVKEGPAAINGLPKEELVDLPQFETLLPGPPHSSLDAGGDPATCASGGWDQGGGS